MGALFSSRAAPKPAQSAASAAASAAASRDEAAFAEAEGRLPPVSGVRALHNFAIAEARRLGDMSRLMIWPSWTLQRLTYARGPLESVDFLELSGARRMELRLQAGEEALLALVDVPMTSMFITEPQPRPCILVARRAIPAGGPRVQVQVADGSVVECDAEAIAEAQRAAIRRSGLRHIPRAAITAWRCDNRWAGDNKGNVPQFDRPRFGPDPNLRPPPMTGGVPAAEAMARIQARIDWSWW